MNISKRQAAAAMGLTIAAFLVFIIVWQHQKPTTRLRQEIESLTQQVKELVLEREHLQSENQRLAKAQTISQEQLSELLRLRSEVALLRRQLAVLAKTGRADTKALAPQPKAAVTDNAEAAKDDEFIAPAKQVCMTAMLNVRMVALQGEDAGMPPLKGPDAENLELLYKEPLQGIGDLNPATIIVRQKQPMKLPSGQWARLYGFADGSVLEAKTTDGDFEKWEAEYAAKYLKKQP